MDLGLAGMISGAGEAGTKSLSMAQAQFGASQLQAERDAMDNLRQDRLLEAQRGMHTETLAATASEGKLTRAAASEEAGKNREHQTNMQGEQQTFQHGENVDTQTHQKALASDTNALHRELALHHDDLLSSIAKLDRLQKGEHFDKTFTSAKLTAGSAAIQTLESEIRYARTLLANPLLDPKSAIAKSTEADIAEAKQRLEGFVAKQAEMMGASGHLATAAQPAPGFKLDPSLAVAPSAAPKGLANTAPVLTPQNNPYPQAD
jgi:hypothetical protein